MRVKPKVVRVRWGPPQPVKQGRKTFFSETALVARHVDRFLLYPTSPAGAPSMWTLWDVLRDSQHFLYAVGWEQARVVAAKRIRAVLLRDTSETRT